MAARIRHRLMARTDEMAEPGVHWPWATVVRNARKREGRPL